MTIKRLRMKNFRLHEDAEITFDDTAQLTLLSGVNGSGKSSVLEAIHYAIWATGRSTKTRLDSMVRAGCELEGMAVELDLVHNGHEYAVERKYEEDTGSQALLTMDGTEVAQGPREVTKYFAQLFGMDSKGFDLAVFATQKELNGLTSMRASSRAQTVSRLVRADVFTKARDDARTEMNDTKRLLQNLGELPEISDLETVRDLRKQELDGAVAAQSDAVAAAGVLEKELRDRSDVQERFREAHAVKARTDGQLTAAKKAVADSEKELADAVASMPDRPDVPKEDLGDLEDELDVVSTSLATAREAANAERDREVLGKECDALTEQRDELKGRVGAYRGNVESTSAVVKAEQDLKQKRRDLEDITTKGQDANARLAVVGNQLTTAEQAVERLTGLDAECPTCEQGIPDDHRDVQVQKAQDTVADFTTQKANLEGELEALRNARVVKIDEVKAAEKYVTEARAAEAQISSDEKQLDQVERTLSMHQRRISALPQPGEPVAPLAEKRAELASKVQAVRNAERALRDWERMENTRTAAETAVSRAQLNLEQATKAYEEAEIPQELADAVDELGVIAARLAAERDLASECTTLAAVAEQRLKAAQSELDAAQTETTRRSKMVRDVEHAEAAARLLTASATHMTSRIRPALEGAVGTILSAMSEGRYDAVKIDKDYNIQVRVDTGFRALAEMSGGEQDLVALALRLGLSRIVSATHGATGPDFLVLDEVFGSQDVRRRETILEALKTLRNVFPQVLLVSHVGGAEDQVDQLIEFELIEGDDSAGTHDSSLITVE